jgi:NACalpha-BTF3-like transcription factor
MQPQNLKDVNDQQDRLNKALPNLLPKIAEVDQLGDQLSRIELLKGRVNTGPITSRFGTIADSIDSLADADRIKLKSQTGNALSTYIKSLSGATVTEPEVERLKLTIPTDRDGDVAFKAKLKEFNVIVDSIRTRHLREAGFVPTQTRITEPGSQGQGFSGPVESGIQKVMQKNNISRDQAIEALKKAGKL